MAATVTTNALGILAAKKADKAAQLAAIDLLEDAGRPAGRWLCSRLLKGKASREELERAFVDAGLLSVKDTPTFRAAAAFQTAAEKVKLEEVPVMSRDRGICRKERANLARHLFKRLGLHGVSVTAPHYSMAHSVDVRLPKREDHDRAAWPHDHTRCCRQGDGRHGEETRCPACAANAAAEAKVERALARAFPNHDDRSDLQSDYFDFCWSING
jgi:hypothetical protein